MFDPRRLLVLLGCAVGACALSAPAALAASSNGQGVMLSGTGHGVRLVDGAHRVGDVRVDSARGLRRGDVVSVRKGRVHVSGHVRRLSFLGRVVGSSARGVVVRVGDGSVFKLSSGRPHGRRARSAALGFQGLSAGQTVLVTLATDAQGNVAIAIRAVPSPTDIGDGELHVSGVVIDDEGEGAFAIRGGGGGLRFSDPRRLLEAADAGWCDVVDVAFHKSGRRLIADELRVTGQSSDGDCSEDGDWADEVDGTVTELAADGSALTVEPEDGGGARTIPVVDASLLDGIEVGDDVAITLIESGTAIDVELLDWSEDPGEPSDGEDE